MILKHNAVGFFFTIFFSCLVVSFLVCVGCVILGHILSKLALWCCYRSEFFHPGSYIQDTVVSKLYEHVVHLNQK